MLALKIKNLTKQFGGVKAVNNLSIEIERGKITGIVGPNGSGKTTLINLLSGVVNIDNGSAMFDGSRKLNKIKSHQIFSYGVTRTFQEVRLFNQMTVLDNILVVITERNIFSSLFEKHKKYHFSKAKEVLEKIGLWEKRNQLAVNLSYGQRKLLEIARVLAINTEIILLDEPFAGLFPEMIKKVSNIVKELKQKGKTIILIEHNMDLIRELSDYVFVMDEGILLAEGKPNTVLEKREVIEAYLGE